MVYCVKCGAQNPDDARVCGKCGVSLYSVRERRPHRRVEDECFGIPKSSGIVSLIIGLMIILIGVSFLAQELYDVSIPWWPMIVIFFGLLIIIGAIYKSRLRY